jgi:chromosome segregation ATPase
MSSYSQDKFSAESSSDASDLPYQLKLSVDILSVKNLTVSANVFAKFSLNLQASGCRSNKTLVQHIFAAKEPTAVNSGGHDTKLTDSFASFEFVANKQELGAILSRCEVDVSIVQQSSSKEVGRVGFPLKHLESGEQKKTPSSMVIVADKYVEMRHEGSVTGMVRVVVYLEDLGVVKKQTAQNLAAPITAANSIEDQIVWQLEMWKRAEMAKFMAHLK